MCIRDSLYTAATIANKEGIFRSDDAGRTWLRLNDDQHQYGAPSPVIGDPRIYGRVYFGTNGRGIIYGDMTENVATASSREWSPMK